ncbi:MFS transporter [Notoacmeibacter ruber]|uniref:MFS transporter n=1 Tax=Notoacmeibacter ruber TaxID=2670375 RepID=A0A3L7JDC8_9HYPH|nr:MFS transporter [Notoacmeibacter ruber]RLQ88757.1 MFS transporter [Notoacmeibacter ruber]
MSADKAGVHRSRWPFARIAVSCAFLQAGLIVGSWAPKIPEFATRMGVDERGMGLFIFLFGIGSLLTMPLAGRWAVRKGPRPVMLTGLWLALLILPALTVAPTPLAGGLVLFLSGAAVGLVEVGMNSAASETEVEMGRPIMSATHGFWSLGGFIGASSGGWLIAHYGLWIQVAVASLAAFAATSAASFWQRPAERIPQAGDEKDKANWPLTPLPYLVAGLTLIAYVAEGALLDWSAFFLREERGISVALSGYAFGLFSAAMALVRFVGDPLRARFGLWKVLATGAVIAGSGLFLFGTATPAPLILLGALLVGIGLSNMVPVLFALASSLPGVPAATGIAIVSTFGFSGVLLAPSLIGLIASWTSLGAVMVGLSALLAVFLALLPLVRGRIDLPPAKKNARVEDPGAA